MFVGHSCNARIKRRNCGVFRARDDRESGGVCLALVQGTESHRDQSTHLQGNFFMHARALVDRVRGEFNEMPGLQLTIPQASRLLGIEHDACRDVIETLVASSFLRRTPAGMVVRTER